MKLISGEFDNEDDKFEVWGVIIYTIKRWN